jgi:hypothetical protein
MKIPKTVIAVIVMTMGICVLAEARADPVDRGPPAGTADSRVTARISPQMSTFPRVGTGTNVFDPNARVLKILTGK